MVASKTGAREPSRPTVPDSAVPASPQAAPLSWNARYDQIVLGTFRSAQITRCAYAAHSDTAVVVRHLGLAALQLARSGAPIATAVSNHGSLTTRARAEPGQVRARLLVCHGALDPHVPLTDVTAFAEGMNAVGADWQLNVYGGAQHGFTHTDAKPGAIPGVAY
jgi:predicted esterase